MCFALAGTDILFSGDHVMGWSTTVVSPPDGSMGDYMRSLDRLLARPERRYLPGHGGPIANGIDQVRGLRTHRRMREAAIIERLRQGDRTIGEIVAVLYRGVDPRLTGAAGRSVLAHLEDLVERGIVAAEGPLDATGTFKPAL
jgi:glyoxylase-like metal-dependent hydrolase (beta-lactamase superfamily II)